MSPPRTINSICAHGPFTNALHNDLTVRLGNVRMVRVRPVEGARGAIDSCCRALMSSAPWRALSEALRHDDHGVAGVAIALFNRRDRQPLCRPVTSPSRGPFAALRDKPRQRGPRKLAVKHKGAFSNPPNWLNKCGKSAPRKFRISVLMKQRRDVLTTARMVFGLSR